MGASLESTILPVIKAFGFDSFMYGMSTVPQPQRESRSYVWTTLPREWVAIYDRHAYIEIDPRLTHCWHRVTPYVWDRHVGDDNPRVAAFLDHAAQYGVGSGVVLPLRDPLHPLVLVAFNALHREITEKRRYEINLALGNLALFAAHFHELFMAHVVDAGIPPGQQGAPLSPREIECLQFAARGLTSRDIGERLCLAERTIQFHFSNLMSKLAVANRHEAIAVAIGRGIIKP